MTDKKLFVYNRHKENKSILLLYFLGKWLKKKKDLFLLKIFLNKTEFLVFKVLFVKKLFKQIKLNLKK